MSTPPSAFVAEADVHAAALALTDEGIYPSVLAIRRRLGNRGSSTTISKHLRSWRTGPGREALARVIAPADGSPADPEIEALLQLHPRVVDKLRAQVESRFRAQVQALEQALASVRDEADGQAQALADATEARAAAESRTDAAVCQVGQLAQECAAIRQQQAVEAAAQAVERATASTRLSTCERELGAAEAAQRALHEDIRDRDQAISQLRADQAASQAAHREAERRIDTDLAQLAALRDTQVSLTAEVTDLRAQLASAQQQTATLAADRQNLTVRLADHMCTSAHTTEILAAIQALTQQVSRTRGNMRWLAHAAKRFHSRL